MSKLLVKLCNMTIRTHQRILVSNVNVEVQPQQITALCGVSGSGKSLTARAIMGVLDVDPGLQEGELYYPELDDTNWFAGVCQKGMKAQRKLLSRTRHLRGKYFTYSPQSASSALNPGRTIGRQIELAIRRRDSLPDNMAKEICRILDEVGLRHDAAMSIPAELSGGMCQRAALAIAIAPAPRLVVADEPETGLDPVLRRTVIELLVNTCRQNSAGLLLISHHEDTVSRIADNVVRLTPYHGGEA